MKKEHGQTSVEYIFVLAVMVGLTLVLIKEVLKPTLTKLQTKIEKRMGTFGGDLHQFRNP